MTSKKIRRFLLAILLLAAAVWLLFGALKRLQKQVYPLFYADTVRACAQEYDLDPLLVYAFIRTESSFDPAATSNVGARGLMQITEETAAWIHSKLYPGTVMDFDDMYLAETNIRYGCYYVSACLRRYDGDIATAAAAYHSGWGTVDALLQKSEYSADGDTLDDFPYSNMNRYVEKIQKNYGRYQSLYPDYPAAD